MRLPDVRQPIREWCWRFGSMRRWRGSARRGRSTACVSSTRPIAGCAGVRRSITICWRNFGASIAALLDRLLTQSVTGLIAEKLITLEELMIDGTKVRAYAGRGSLCKRKRLERIEQAVAERVAELKSELDTDPGEPERRRKKRALQAAEERVRRVERARPSLAELAQEKAG